MKQVNQNRQKIKKEARDPQKEGIIRELSTILSESGYDVRRERLKQDYGWRVVSGTCRAGGSKYVFVDRALTQDDQVEFLVSKIRELGAPLSEERAASLPPAVVNLIKYGILSGQAA